MGGGSGREEVNRTRAVWAGASGPPPKLAFGFSAAGVSLGWGGRPQP